MIGDSSAQVPICLFCREKVEHIQHLSFIRAAAAYNQAADDMDSIIPIAPISGRIPVADLARAMNKTATYNNISISNSQVGVVNTGDLAKIDAAITLSKGSDADVIGQKLQEFTQLVIDSAEINASKKQEIVDLLQVLADQALRERKPSVVRSLLRSIAESVKDVSSLAAGADSLFHAIKDFLPLN